MFGLNKIVLFSKIGNSISCAHQPPPLIMSRESFTLSVAHTVHTYSSGIFREYVPRTGGDFLGLHRWFINYNHPLPNKLGCQPYIFSTQMPWHSHLYSLNLHRLLVCNWDGCHPSWVSHQCLTDPFKSPLHEHYIALQSLCNTIEVPVHLLHIADSLTHQLLLLNDLGTWQNLRCLATFVGSATWAGGWFLPHLGDSHMLSRLLTPSSEESHRSEIFIFFKSAKPSKESLIFRLPGQVSMNNNKYSQSHFNLWI